MKRFLALLLCIIVAAAAFDTADVNVYAMGEKPGVSARSAVMIKITNGEVIYNKEMDLAVAPASTTKMLTALIAIENLEMDEIVTVDAETAKTGESSMFLKEGEEISVRNLLYGLMLVSANDAAVALAKAVSGSVESFAVEMNQRAAELGATNSNFVTLNGLPNDQHYSTAHDLGMIAYEAIKNDTFREIVQTVEYTVPETNMFRERSLKNTNELLWNDTATLGGDYLPDKMIKYDGVLGIKTGHTNAAGYCLVSGAKRSGTGFITVVMGCASHAAYYSDTTKLLDYGFNNYVFKPVYLADGKVDVVKVKGSKTKKVTAISTVDIGAMVSIDEGVSVLRAETEIDKKIKAPFDAGTTVGAVKLYYNDELYGEYPLYTKEGAEKSTFAALFGPLSGVIPVIMKIIVILFAAAVIVYIIFAVNVNIKTAKRKKERKKRREEKNSEKK